MSPLGLLFLSLVEIEPSGHFGHVPSKALTTPVHMWGQPVTGEARTFYIATLARTSALSAIR